MTSIGKTYDGQTYQGSGIKKASAGNPEFKWLEDFYGGRYAKVSVVVGTTAAITLTVTGAGSQSAYIFTVGDVVRNARTGENFLVDTIGSATTITAASAGRAFGTTAAATCLAGDGLYIIGNANAENGSARNVNTTRSSTQSNYTQIFKNSTSLSDTAKNSDTYGENDLTYQRRKAALQHGEDIERAFIWGQKKLITTGHQTRGTGGILEFIESNNSYVQDQNGPLTAPDFNIFLREGSIYGRNQLFMCGSLVLGAINEIARDSLRTVASDKTFGITISEWNTVSGPIKLMQHPLLVNDWAGYGFLLDMECFRYRYMNNRDTQLKTNVQAPDVDGEIDQIITECGLERKQAARCALIKGITD